MSRQVSLSSLVFTSLLVLSACSKPTDIVLGEKPLETLVEHRDDINKLPVPDRELLANYVLARQAAAALPGLAPASLSASSALPGKTVDEVLDMARKYKAEEAARHVEAEALKQRVLAERKVAMDRISQAVSVAFVKKTVIPRNFEAGRFDAQLHLLFGVENKSAQNIRLLKGKIHFADAAGDALGDLNIEFDEVIPAGSAVQSSTGSYWRLDGFTRELERIAFTSDGGLKASFEPASVVFADGTVLKAPTE